MRNFFFHIGYGFFYLLSLLPFWFFYRVSDVTAFLLARVFKYRRAVVKANMGKAFPHFSSKQINDTADEFYRRFCDNFLETVKLLSISEKELARRFEADTALLQHLHATSPKNITIVLAHVFNWEMANPAIALQNPFLQLIIYKKVGNNFFEWMMMRLRERFQAKLLSTVEFKIAFKNFQQKRYSLVLLADQNQSDLKSAYWATFFGERVPFPKGPEKSAMLNDDIVVFGKIYRKQRGFYSNTITMLTDDAPNTPKGFITKKIITHTEDNIKADPANYLWSHKRFKHVDKYTEAFKKNLID